jgi:hypothetical protein
MFIGAPPFAGMLEIHENPVLGMVLPYCGALFVFRRWEASPFGGSAKRPRGRREDPGDYRLLAGGP